LNCSVTFTQSRIKVKRKLVEEYISGKQTFAQLKFTHGYDHKTIRKHIDQLDFNYPCITPRTCVIGIDTCFFGELTTTLVRDITNRQNLVWQFGMSEYRRPYQDLYQQILKANITMLGVVADGRPYFFEMFGEVPVQMCHFHMGKILARYLTRNPKLEVNKALWEIWHDRDKFNEKSFNRMLDVWWNRYAQELDERYMDRFGRVQYVKIKTRKAYFSLKRYLPWLYTYKKIRWIPKTNNSIEGVFSGVKTKVNVHNGLSIGRKMKLIHYLLSQN